MNARLRDVSADSLRLPPQSGEAEQAVLGGLMLAPDAFDTIADRLEESDFYRRDHQLIFRAISELAIANKPRDIVTLGEWLEANQLTDHVATGYLIGLATNTPSAANIEAYAQIVREKAVMRRAIQIGTQLVQSGFTDGPESIDTAIRELMELAKVNTRHDGTLRDALREAWKDITDAHEHPGVLRGITSGLERLDHRLGGFHSGDFSIFAARPAMGKTALLLHFTAAATRAGHAVGIISAEMAKMQLGQRHLAMASRVPAYNMRNGHIGDDDWSRISVAMSSLIERRYHIYDRSAPTLEEVIRTARRWKQQHNIEALYVDYLQRIRVSGVPRNEEVAEVSRAMKTLARDLEIPVICAAQVKADVENRSDQRPRMADVANSDEACREADQVVMLYRDEVPHENTTDKGIAELNVEKNRHGPTGQIRCAWLAETMTFGNLEFS